MIQFLASSFCRVSPLVAGSCRPVAAVEGSKVMLSSLLLNIALNLFSGLLLSSGRATVYLEIRICLTPLYALPSYLYSSPSSHLSVPFFIIFVLICWSFSTFHFRSASDG